jgi:hypothetical protein
VVLILNAVFSINYMYSIIDIFVEKIKKLAPLLMTVCDEQPPCSSPTYTPTYTTLLTGPPSLPHAVPVGSRL